MYAITVSTRYEDFLKLVLPQNYRFFTKWIIVTDKKDVKTLEVIKKKNFQNIVVMTFDFYQGADFNKGGAIRKAQKYVNRLITSKDNLVLILDSDIFLPDDFDEIISKVDFQEGTLYGVSKRLDYPNYNSFITGKNYSEHLCGRHFIGCFQLYIMKYGEYKLYHNSKDCGGCDNDFRELFSRRINIESLTIKHLGNEIINWYGRKAPCFNSTT